MPFSRSDEMKTTPTDVLEWNRTALALGKSADVPALLDALEQAVKECDYWEQQAENANDDKQMAEEALVELALFALRVQSAGPPEVKRIADDALRYVPPDVLRRAKDELETAEAAYRTPDRN
jgi:hypothetical protein